MEVVWHVCPQPLPQRRLALAWTSRDDERGQRAAAPQRGAIARPACRGTGLQRQERNRGARAAQGTRASAFNEMIGVVADGLFAGSVDEQSFNVIRLPLEGFAILKEPRGIPVEQHGPLERRECSLQFAARRRV